MSKAGAQRKRIMLLNKGQTEMDRKNYRKPYTCKLFEMALKKLPHTWSDEEKH